MSRIPRLLQLFRRDERGATALEYGLLAALIAVVIIAGVTLLGTNLNTMFTNLSDVVKAQADKVK